MMTIIFILEIFMSFSFMMVPMVGLVLEKKLQRLIFLYIKIFHKIAFCGYIIELEVLKKGLSIIKQENNIFHKAIFYNV